MRRFSLSITLLLFLFQCKGKGAPVVQTNSPSVEIYLNGVRLDSGSSLQLGSLLQNSVAQTYPIIIRNTGTDAVNLVSGSVAMNTSSAYSISGLSFPAKVAAKSEVSGVLTANPITVGNMHFSMLVSTDNAAQSAVNINCSVSVTATPSPEIAVQQGVTNIVSGGGAYGYGTVLTGSNSSVVFTVYNLGTAALNIGGAPTAQLAGPNAAEFSVISYPGSSVAALATTTFTVQFTPASAGTKTAYVQLVNNDSDESIFVVNLSATGQVPAPEINLTQGAPSYLTGSTYTYSSAVAGGTYDAVFTIQNLGTGPLTLSGAPLVSLGGTNAADFSLQAAPSSPIAAAGSTSFTIRFRPTSAGAKTASLTISNNDSNEATYQVFLASTVTAPEIAVKYDPFYVPTDLTSGNTLNLEYADTTDGEQYQFRIDNTGNSTLNLTGTPAIQFTGTNAADFTLSMGPATTVAAGGSTYFYVTVRPGALSPRSATIVIPNNDYDEGPFTIPISIGGNVFVQKRALSNYWQARSFASVVAFNGEIYVLGGLPNDVWSSSDGVNWISRNSSPGWSLARTAIAHQTKLLVFESNKIWQSFDGINYTIARATAPWGDRDGVGYASLGGLIYAFGGYSSWNSTYNNDVWTSADGINWTKINNAASWGGRSGMHTTVHNSKIYIIGGNSRRDCWSTSDGLTWTMESNNALPVRNSAALVSLGTKMYLVGGTDSTGFATADIYSTTNGVSFTLETSAPGFPQRYGHAAATFGGKVYVIAGYTGSTAMSDVYEAIDGVNYTKLLANADIFEPRWGHQVANLNGTLVLTGGKDILTNHKNDSWTSTNGTTWRVRNLNTPWTARRGHTMTVHNNKIYLIAGGTAASVGNLNKEVWQTTDGITYTLVTSNPAFSARFYHTAASFGGKLWVFGGTNTSNIQLNDAWSSPDGVTWTASANTPFSLEGATLTVHNGELYMAGGYCAGLCSPQYRKEVYKSTDGTVWTAVSGQLISGVAGLFSASYANRLFFLGGGTPARSAQAHILSGTSVFKLTLTSLFGARDATAAVVFDDGSGEKLWVFGGGVDALGISNDIMTMQVAP